MTESESSNTYIAGYEHSFFPSRPGLCVLGMLEASQVPWVDVRTCMGSWTPRSLTALTNTDGLVLPSTTGTVSALRMSAISSLISPAHAHRYRRFAHPLAGTDARLAAKVARYTFLSAGLAPAVHARVSLAHPRQIQSGLASARENRSLLARPRPKTSPPGATLPVPDAGQRPGSTAATTVNFGSGGKPIICQSVTFHHPGNAGALPSAARPRGTFAARWNVSTVNGRRVNHERKRVNRER